MFEANDSTGRVLDTTQTDMTASRADEIAAWLAEHAMTGYAIIGDH